MEKVEGRGMGVGRGEREHGHPVTMPGQKRGRMVGDSSDSNNAVALASGRAPAQLTESHTVIHAGS